MVARHASTGDARAGNRGLVAGAVDRLARLIGWLLLSLVVSILLEWIGLTFWWPEEGAEHSRDMIAAELAYLGTDYRRSLLTDDPAGYAEGVAEAVYYGLWERTGLIELVRWMAGSPPPDASVIRQALHGVHEYAMATVNITEVFTVRIAILTLALPVFGLFGIVGLTDGLVQRDLRRWGGGRESSYIFHWAAKFIAPAFVLSWLLYLSLPVSVNPGYVVLPFAALWGFTLRVAASTFKKYL